MTARDRFADALVHKVGQSIRRGLELSKHKRDAGTVTVSDCYQWATPRCLVIGAVHWTGQGIGSAALDSEVMPP